jgi:CDP-glucose 4,6-dehydratase
MFNNTFDGKKVFITGHTGFKGTWLTTWLLELGAEVHGFSNEVPTSPSAFEIINLADKINETRGDVTDFGLLKSSIEAFEPDFIFHLAAQALVSISYSDPLQTLNTNIMGVANIMEVSRSLQHKCTMVVVTSDKCYENVEWEWGYKETDHLGGKDIYSGSKGAAEVVFHAYYNSFFIDHSYVKVASARAGNVIGGGDWAKDRIIADCVRAWSVGDVVEIRSPAATRPWQHVLEPLSGYLALASELWNQDDSHSGQSFNFGPISDKNRTVLEVIDSLSQYWNPKVAITDYFMVTGNVPFHEAGLLKLNCDKAVFHLDWEPSLTFDQCVELVGDWYDQYYNSKGKNMFSLTVDQIRLYCDQASVKKITWML